jgi:hypothetical protein
VLRRLDMPLADVVLRDLVSPISNLQMLEPPKPRANSIGVVYPLMRTDAKEGEDFRVWIDGPTGEATEAALNSYFRQQLALQGFFVNK